MGFGYIQDDGPIMCFNGAKSWQTGWYASKSTVVNPSTGGCFEGNLFGIADFGNAASSTVLLKINDLSSTDYYVAFNRQTGINSGTQEAGNQVTVTRQGAEGTGYAESELVAKLGQGGTWSGAVAGKNMVVTVLSVDLASAPAFARVRISENGGSCTSVPTPSAKPTTRKPTSASTTRKPTSATTTRKPTANPTATPTQAPTTLKNFFPTYAPTYFF